MSTGGPPNRSGGGAPSVRASLDRWSFWLIVALLIIIGAMLISRCSGDDHPKRNGNRSASPTGHASSAARGNTGSPIIRPRTSRTATSAPATSTSVSSPKPRPSAPQPGSALKANGTDLLPLSSSAGARGDLSRYAGQTVTADRVVVQSVPAMNGFWLGTSTTDRIWVQLREAGLVYPHPVRAGDRLSFTGHVVANSEAFVQSAGADSGTAQLCAQKAHIEVNKSALRFTG